MRSWYWMHPLLRGVAVLWMLYAVVVAVLIGIR